MSVFDLAVVGLGAMGTATFETAVRRGLRVIAIEQYAPVHAFGGSHGRVRLIRRAYYEDPAYVPLVQRAYELWAELERRAGKQLLTITGLLQVGGASSFVLRGVRESAQRHGLDVRAYDAAELRRRFSMFRPLDDEVGLYEPGAGVLIPELALEVQLALAMSGGGEARFRVRVERWGRSSDGSLELALSDGSLVKARKLAICCGAWLGELLPAVAPAIRVRRKVQVWFAPQADAFAPDRCPAFLVDREAFGQVLYGFPDFGDGVKTAFHTGGEETTTAAIDRTVHDGEIEAIRSALESWLPGAGACAVDASVCLYDMTPDEHFILGLIPDAPDVVVAGGFSGHGFKFSSVIGEIVADLVTDGATRHEIGFLAPHRLGEGFSFAQTR